MFKTKHSIENLTAQEFGLAYQAFIDLVRQEHLTFLNMEAKNDFGSSTFVPVTEVNFFRTRRERSDDLRNLDMEDMIEAVQSFQLECKSLENKRGFYVYQKAECDEYDLEELYYEVEWNEVLSDISENEINSKFKVFVRVWLRPEGNTDYTRDIDCKLLQLFKQGSIDWKTLRTLVYTDCEV